MALSFCHRVPFFKGVSAREKLQRGIKRCTSDISFLAAQRKVPARIQTCLTMQRLLQHSPHCHYHLDCHQQQEQKMSSCMGGERVVLSLSCCELLFLTDTHFTFVCLIFSMVHSRRKLRMRNIHMPSDTEKPTALFLAVIPAEVLEISLLHPVLPLLLNEMAATAPPLGSISRPLCWQKEQQITFTWIVRFIIISRWQSLHYNAAEKRLTSFQIKIYNANTHL